MNKKVLLIISSIFLAFLVILLSCLGIMRVNAEPAAPEATATPAPTPTPKPTPTPEPEYYTISFIGDLTLASSQYNNDFENKMKDDYSYPFKNTVEYFENDDLTVGNLECTFSDKYMSSYTTFNFLAPAAFANILVEGGVDFVTTANNHSDDFSDQGIADTDASLDAVDMPHAGENGTYIYDMGDIKVGIYCAFNGFQPSISKTETAIADLREAGAQYIICAFHWGNEGTYRPTQDQKNLAHAAIDAGANVVYGSHPHVLQPVEEYGDGLIMYSMGNFSFGGNTAPRDRDSAIVQVTVKREFDGTITTDGYSLIPCCLSSTDNINDYCPKPYDEGTEEYDRAMSKLDGSFAGNDLSVDYSQYH